MARVSGLELTLENWRDLLISLEEPPYRAEQIGDWIYRKKIFSFKDMTNLSQGLRQKLTDAVDLILPDLVKERTSLRDGTKKFLWRLGDGATVESVFLPHATHKTACLSSQVGCPLGCAFCATGKGGFVRDMTAGEITGHFLAMERHLGAPVQNVVLMGMGEPLLNTAEVFKALRILNAPGMRHLGIRHMALSTAGVVPGIDALADSGLGVRLAVSLHAAEDELRSQLMPVNRVYPLGELRQALLRYQAKTGDRITLEYALLEDVNDTLPHVEALGAFVRGINAFVNLIPYNGDDGNFRCPPQDRMERFRRLLQERQVNVELRVPRGGDVEGACGRLKSASEEGEDRPSRSAGDRPFSDRPRPPHREGEGPFRRERDDRPQAPRPDRFRGEPRPRPEGSSGEDRPRRSAGDRPFSDRPRPPHREGEGPFRRERDDRPQAPRPDRFRGEPRPRPEGSSGEDRPRRSAGDRPFSDRPRPPHREGEGPFRRERDDRPQAPRPDRFRGEPRPRPEGSSGEDRPRRSAGDRPFSDRPRPPHREGEGPFRRERDDRPQAPRPDRFRGEPRPRPEGSSGEDRPRRSAGDRPFSDRPRPPHRE
ncbi:MAG TPA: 23S rRNA (adenine(2503)-C(2))-methyltransferase RlmN, partial [Synergistaceae bacterium]|nr:23S rRNA (adenine(2503)-C(2))-methyltransferase RlmN [Synergistaceae bacterium]